MRVLCIAAMAVLAGCTGGVQPPAQTVMAADARFATPAGPAMADAAALHPLGRLKGLLAQAPPPGGRGMVTGAQYYGSDILVYLTSGSTARTVEPDGGTTLTLEETLTTDINHPDGMVASTSSGLYVANSLASNVLYYKVTSSGIPSTPTAILGDSGQYPYDVDVDAGKKLVAVSNYTTTGFGSGSVSLYKGAVTSPTGTLGVTGNVHGIGVAIDKVGNCFWSYESTSSSPSGTIVEFPKCKGTATTIATGLGFAGGMAFDASNNLYYVDQSVAAVYKCVGTSSCGVFASGFSDPVFINFDSKWAHLWLDDEGTGDIYALDPATGTVLSTTTVPGGASNPPTGVAPIPGSKY